MNFMMTPLTVVMGIIPTLVVYRLQQMADVTSTASTTIRSDQFQTRTNQSTDMSWRKYLKTGRSKRTATSTPHNISSNACEFAPRPTSDSSGITTTSPFALDIDKRTKAESDIGDDIEKGLAIPLHTLTLTASVSKSSLQSDLESKKDVNQSDP